MRPLAQASSYRNKRAKGISFYVLTSFSTKYVVKWVVVREYFVHSKPCCSFFSILTMWVSTRAFTPRTRTQEPDGVVIFLARIPNLDGE